MFSAYECRPPKESRQPRESVHVSLICLFLGACLRLGLKWLLSIPVGEGLSLDSTTFEPLGSGDKPPPTKQPAGLILPYSSLAIGNTKQLSLPRRARVGGKYSLRAEV